MGGACGMHGKEKCTKVLVRKPKRKRPLGRLRHRWDQNGSWGYSLGGGGWSGFS
jgi:hypothetical protein